MKLSRRGILRRTGVGLVAALMPSGCGGSSPTDPLTTLVGTGAAGEGAGNAAWAQESRRWPHEISVNGAQVTVYEPQAISWPQRKTLTARAALAIRPAGAKGSVLGTIDVELQTTTDAATGLVHLSDPNLITSHFPSLDTQQGTAMDSKIRAVLSNMQLPSVPLAAVLVSLNQAPTPNVAVRNDPPEIFYSDKPASLVVFDGDPVLVPIGTTGLSYAVNTNWDVFNDGSTWYLLAGSVWMEASRAVGPYRPAAELPAAFGALPQDANFANARANIPAHPPGAGTPVPAIFVSTKRQRSL